jgi:predicted ABC-type transport system involved in lysophospholipase L1 biosynthesis ATPase subunit
MMSIALTRSGQRGYRRHIGFVFQCFHLLTALTILDKIAAPLLPCKTDFDKFEKAHSLLDAVGLPTRLPEDCSLIDGAARE